MKIFKLIIPLFLICCNSPSIEETQNFIINKIEKQEFCNRENIRNIYSTYYSVEFNDGNIKISQISRNLSGLKDLLSISETIIPIKSLKDIYFDEFTYTDRTKCVRLNMKSDKSNIVSILKTANNGMKPKKIEKIKASFVFKTKIEEDNLDTRLIEAFQHLVRLYGGTDLTDPF